MVVACFRWAVWAVRWLVEHRREVQAVLAALAVLL